MIGIGISTSGYTTYATSVPLLLDTYTADVGYSFRKLRTAYSGNCIRIRRSNDDAETDIGFVNNILDTASISSFVGANSAYITTWYDQVGSFNLTQTTGANQPRIVNAGTLDTRNSLPAAVYNGTSSALSYTVSAPINIASISHFTVNSNDVANGVGCVLTQYSFSPGGIRVFNDRRTNKRNLVVTNGTPTTYNADMSVQRDVSDIRLLSSFIDASANMSAFDNGATGTTATYTPTVSNNSLILGNHGGTSYLTGTIQEVILFNTDESTNRTAIEANINDYYTIY